MRLYNSLIISTITYISASWTHTKCQKKCIDAFNTKALHRIVGVRWYDYVTNASILTRTGQPPLTTTIRKLRVPSDTSAVCNRHPSHRHSGFQTTVINDHGAAQEDAHHSAGLTKSSTTPMSLDAVTATYDRTSWGSLVRDATRPTTQATKASKY